MLVISAPSALCFNMAIYTRKNKTRLIFPRINGPIVVLVIGASSILSLMVYLVLSACCSCL